MTRSESPNSLSEKGKLIDCLFFLFFFRCCLREWREALALGVDGVVTDYPGKFVAVRDGNFTLPGDY